MRVARSSPFGVCSCERGSCNCQSRGSRNGRRVCQGICKGPGGVFVNPAGQMEGRGAKCPSFRAVRIGSAISSAGAEHLALTGPSLSRIHKMPSLQASQSVAAVERRGRKQDFYSEHGFYYKHRRWRRQGYAHAPTRMHPAAHVRLVNEAVGLFDS